MHIHEDRNSRLDFKHTDNLIRDFRAECFTLFRKRNQVHLMEEVWKPLCATSRTLSVVAIEERPWPPKGVGAKAIRGLVIASLSDDGQALLTPGFLHPAEAINIGLASALTKYLLETLLDQNVEQVAFFVNAASRVVATLLSDAGFSPGAARVVFDGAEFVNFSASPAKVLALLGLDKVRLGDVLSMRVESMRLTQWTALHLGMSVGISPFWDGLTLETEVFPGIIDWAALPTAGITGTKGPSRIDDPGQQ